MKKTEKGTPGYLSHKKHMEIIRTIIYFGIVAAIFSWVTSRQKPGSICLLL